MGSTVTKTLNCVEGLIQCFIFPLDEKPTKRLTLKGMRHCSLTKSSRNRNIAVYTPGEKVWKSFVAFLHSLFPFFYLLFCLC